MTLLFCGSLARIFTSIQETGDVTVVTTYIVAFIVNAIIVGQVIYYWNSVTVTDSNKSK